MEVTYFETHRRRSTTYMESITEDELGNVIRKKRVYFPLVECDWQGKHYFLQYDDQMNLLYDVCYYLNSEIASSSERTRRFKSGIVRRYLCFMTLSGYEYNNVRDQFVVDRIQSFFRAEDYRSASGGYSLSHQSLNNYTSVIRDFLRFCYVLNGYGEEDFGSSKFLTPSGLIFPRITLSSVRENSHKDDFIRPFIYPEELKNLILLAKAKNDYQAIILFCLMFFYGLRIGECLGLTVEDIVMRKKNYQPSPTLLLRNRLSDKSFQFSKGLFHPKSYNDYNGKSYPSQKVVLTMNFYEKFTMFVESTIQYYESKGVLDRSVADSISSSYEKEKVHNHYIFLNKYGKPLSQQAWNRRLKEYFLAAGIPLDIDVKRDNLNHRFRHGCAMYYLHFSVRKMSVELVSALLRHKNISTTFQYTKMDVESRFTVNEEFQDFLLEEIPQLFV